MALPKHVLRLLMLVWDRVFGKRSESEEDEEKKTTRREASHTNQARPSSFCRQIGYLDKAVPLGIAALILARARKSCSPVGNAVVVGKARIVLDICPITLILLLAPRILLPHKKRRW